MTLFSALLCGLADSKSHFCVLQDHDERDIAVHRNLLLEQPLFWVFNNERGKVWHPFEKRETQKKRDTCQFLNLDTSTRNVTPLRYPWMDSCIKLLAQTQKRDTPSKHVTPNRRAWHVSRSKLWYLYETCDTPTRNVACRLDTICHASPKHLICCKKYAHRRWSVIVIVWR